jgi:transcriptional regulator with XRE-family HTH domain
MVQIPRLREWREARALTQVELAELANVSSRSVAGYEAGAGARPPTVRRLAEALGVKVVDLREDPDSPKAEAPPSQQLTLNGMLTEERRTPTLSQRRAVGALEDRCKHLEAMLKTAHRQSIPLEVWTLESDYALDIAALVLPLIEREHLRPLLRPVATRFTRLAYAVLDGLKDAGAAEEAERRREQFFRMDREIA